MCFDIKLASTLIAETMVMNEWFYVLGKMNNGR